MWQFATEYAVICMLLKMVLPLGNFVNPVTDNIVRHHRSANLSLLSVIQETMSLRSNIIAPTTTVASHVTAIHGWRAIPQKWIDTVNTAERSMTGIAGRNIVEGPIAESLIQTGYRCGARWLVEHGAGTDRLERQPTSTEDEGLF
jgi:hypothetical protein